MSVTSESLRRRESIPSRLFTFRSGGWLLLPGFLFAGAGVWWNLRVLWDPERVPPRGDGRNAASYGFSLEQALDVCARAYVRAVREFFAAHPETSVRTLRLCLLAGPLAALVQKELGLKP